MPNGGAFHRNVPPFFAFETTKTAETLPFRAAPPLALFFGVLRAGLMREDGSEQDDCCIDDQTDTGSAGADHVSGAGDVTDGVGSALVHVGSQSIQTGLSPSVGVLTAVVADSGQIGRASCRERV